MCAALLLAVVFGFAKYCGKHEPVARWTLPDGTELRLEYVTYGTQHRIAGVGVFRAWLSQTANRWLHLRLPYYQAEYRVEDTEFPCPVLWFTLLDPRTGKLSAPKIDGVEVLAEPGAIRLRSLNGNMNTTIDPFPCAAFRITAYPRRAESIPLRIDVGGQIIKENIPNPARGQSFVEWKPEPLPQTKRVGTREFTLKTFELFRSEAGTAKGMVRFSSTFAVRDASAEVSRGFNVGRELLDATGNLHLEILPLDEPAWKVRASFRRTGDYPFAASEGLMLGPVETPEPGAYGEFEVSEAERKNGIRLAAIVGTGRFIWEDGKFLNAKAVAALWDGSLGGFGPGGHVRFSQSYSEPGLMLLIEGTEAQKWVKAENHLVIRLHTGGKGYDLGSGGGSASTDGNGVRHIKRVFAAPLDERRNRVPLSGPISIQIVSVENETVDFLVAPPKLPESPQ